MTNNKDLKIYQKINEYIVEGLVIPYDDDILYFLDTHTDINNKYIKSYLSGLKSTYSISKCYRFARYLALGINKKFHLYEGKLSKLSDSDFTHAWIETDNYVYDVSFIGKWPKKLYYQLFQPQVEKEIDLNNDEKYLEYKKNCQEIQNSNNHVLQYIDWYNYMRFIMIPNPYISINPSWLYFPQDIEKVKVLNHQEFIQTEWKKASKSSPREIPTELFSKELNDFIEQANYLKEKNYIYQELIKFIVDNYELYEEKKLEEYDLTLWRKALEDNYSGSFCLLISEIPKVIIKTKTNDESKKTPNL